MNRLDFGKRNAVIKNGCGHRDVTHWFVDCLFEAFVFGIFAIGFLKPIFAMFAELIKPNEKFFSHRLLSIQSDFFVRKKTLLHFSDLEVAS